jgi:hypothetical protein
MIHDAPAVAAEDAFAVRIVDHQHRLGSPRHHGDAVERRQIAVHREHAVGHNQPFARTGAARQKRLQRLNIGMRVAHDLGSGQSTAVHY